MSERVIPAIGEKILIQVTSLPHRGEYSVIVTESDTEKVVVTMPIRGDGTIVPLAGGETVTITFERGIYKGQVLNRSMGATPTLTLSPPGGLSVAGHSSSEGARFIAVTSGKGGVGKSTLSVNLALALAALEIKVCLVDVDLGTANLDLMLGITAPTNLGHLLDGKSLEDVLIPLSPYLFLLPGSSGVGEIANLNQWQMGRLLSSFNRLSDGFDVVLLDTGAGVSRSVTDFLQAADQVLLVMTPDPTAITDAYALLKVMSANGRMTSPWHLVINKAIPSEAKMIQSNFQRTAFRHLNALVFYLGSIPESRAIATSVRQQHPYLDWGGGDEARAYHQLARMIAGLPPEKKGFLHRFQEALQKLS